MTVRDAIIRQYQIPIDKMAARFAHTRIPSDGWLRTVRKALGMSGAQLARRVGQTRGAITKAENQELKGAITLNTMQAAAEAMGCRFVYAIVPDGGSVSTIVMDQALKKARATVNRASDHMGLESQSLTREEVAQEIERLAQSIAARMPHDLWNDP